MSLEEEQNENESVNFPIQLGESYANVILDSIQSSKRENL